ncbi:Nramp family divalent metal transporter [Clostridium intestinale]|uniref:Natural resistance-associated macrophage protein n=1 Tax=Clostridium intestinale URNW TaxID=1294142 RepID=U2Q0C9_9CLOT|nr:Nramp family divalent metal transporter [Clostridium intestinale]ERK29484.1 natural resistance-associated macrophage protein [Clostridium intestinale URNW]
MEKFIKKINLSKEGHEPKLMAKDFIKYIGPGLLVTVGFIDPGNWASNLAAGSDYGYKLLWMVTLSTIMLIALQHNAAHLGIVTGLCISEAITKFIKPKVAKPILWSAVLASIATAMAELLGAAIALNMLFKIPIKIGSIISLVVVLWMLYTSSYKRLEKVIIGFVSVIGLAFIVELFMVNVNWPSAVKGWFTPSFPENSMPIIMSVLGAVVMPHNLFLHSEIIQSRQWNLKDKDVMEKQLKYEFLDTLVSMTIGWAINSAMILVAVVFFTNNIKISELSEAHLMLQPLLGNWASLIFAIALLFAGISSSVTAGMAGGSIFAGMFNEPYDMEDRHTKIGVSITLVIAAIIIFFISNPFKGLVYSQMLLSIQLPWTVFTQVYLTSSKKVMEEYKNKGLESIFLWVVGIIVGILNIMLLVSSIF